jgi:ATP/maltotriose-dependent transcriptional regulator MalT
MGLAYTDMGKNWQAARHGDKALAAAQKSDNEECVAWASYKLALVLYRQGKWGRAQLHAGRAESLFAQLGNENMTQRAQKMLVRIEQQKGKSTGLFS